MGKRSKGREIVLQSLYAAQLSGVSLAVCLHEQLQRRDAADETAEFAQDLAAKVARHKIEREAELASLLQNWAPERVGVIERAILIVALTELHDSPEVPWKVAINEACELARRFCDESAVGFVNGILDRAATDLRSEEGT